jgi:alkylated DNA repair protein (DNA oxidative demethylase)
MKATPSGLQYFPDILSAREEKKLLKWVTDVGRCKWQQDRMRGQVIRRKYISFGWTYKLYSRSLAPTRTIPSLLRDIRVLCSAQANARAMPFDQMQVIKYPAGAGIGPHIDAPCFGPIVLGLSLGSSCRMLLKHPNLGNFKLSLEPRSLLVLSGESRYSWTHAIASVRSERLSVVMRSRAHCRVGVDAGSWQACHRKNGDC